ncbi:DUF3892 domain-containing protein [Algoriphagus sp. D3-2-R+10]|uniref:DUF3892 domain-containing protein n=1 Tax=Algoriphagus aurantiacus TaxID=3103948 RepID=UPI002B3C44E4|nr:DUF3892 domain-containing protein [Algoriphagus sp. D3-2-R+10]MEB2778605.1 DUF3892 domain-containing protein [Algoriphagus sp. D3-2-R+10]
MKRLRILCSKKNKKETFNRDITHIGGVNGTGEKWTISVHDAIAGIHSGLYEFYIVEHLKELDVRITGDIEKSLTATGQGYLHNLLDDLPDCP